MSEVQINDGQNSTGENEVSHIPDVVGNCPEWLSKAISDLNLYSHDTYGKFRSPNEQVKDLLWKKIHKAMSFSPNEEQIEQASKKYLEVIWDIPRDEDEFKLCDEYKGAFIGMLKILKEQLIGENV